jgi:hypothetical protein
LLHNYKQFTIHHRWCWHLVIMKIMNSQYGRYIIYGQICFYLGLVICAILKPVGLTNNGGISYYGIYSLTILPYCLALLGPSYFCIKFALQLNSPGTLIVNYTLAAISLLTVGLVITPDTWGRFMADAHVTFGSILFSLQLLFSGWLIIRMRYNGWAIALSLVELAAGVASFIYLAPKNGYLIESQIVFQISFGLLAIYSLPRLLTSKTNTPKVGYGSKKYE